MIMYISGILSQQPQYSTSYVGRLPKLKKNAVSFVTSSIITVTSICNTRIFA